MRIRVSTIPPLSPTKVWSSLGSLRSTATVGELKRSLCAQIPALRGIGSDQIQLFMDGFELLDALPIEVVHENDLVHVKRIESNIPTSVLRKRKRSETSTSSSSSSSPSPSSSSSATSSSSSESSSDSESAASSSSESSTSPTNLAALKPPNERQLPKQRPSVPPGMGKPATRSRNIRRRRKLQHERGTATQGPEDPTVGVNAIPLGNHNKTGVPEIVPQITVGGNGEFLDLTMGSLSNKNKRKGFKNAMGKEVPPKIIFSEQGDQNTNTSGLRLVPPSEKQEEGLLPPNVFVTSVDVEEGLWPSKKPKPVMSKTKRSGTPPAARITGEFDRAGAEAKWDSFGLVSSASGLPIGTIVGWKALGINPVTITPEMILHVGRVVSCDENGVAVKFLDWTGFSGGSEEEAEEIEESREWGEVVNQWRIISV